MISFSVEESEVLIRVQGAQKLCHCHFLAALCKQTTKRGGARESRDGAAQVAQAHCVCHMRKYREHMRRSFGLEICWKMGIKIDETYHVVRCCCP